MVMHIMCPPHWLKLRTFKYALLSSPPLSCGALIMFHLAVSAQFSTQSSIINHGNHLWSCEKVSSRNLPNISRPFSRFQTSDTSRSALRRLPSSCSIHLEPRKSSCWHSKLRCWYIPIFLLRSKYDTPPTPWHHFTRYRTQNLLYWGYVSPRNGRRRSPKSYLGTLPNTLPR